MSFTSQDRRYHAAYELLDAEAAAAVNEAYIAARAALSGLHGCKPRNDDAAEALVAAIARYAMDSGATVSYACKLAAEGL